MNASIPCIVLSPLARLLRAWMTDEERPELDALWPRLVAAPTSLALRSARCFLAADGAVRTFAPLRLEAAGQASRAQRLREAPEIRDAAFLRAVGVEVDMRRNPDHVRTLAEALEIHAVRAARDAQNCAKETAWALEARRDRRLEAHRAYAEFADIEATNSAFDTGMTVTRAYVGLAYTSAEEPAEVRSELLTASIALLGRMADVGGGAS